MSPCWISPTSSSTTSSSPSPSSRPLQMTQPARRRFPTAAACGTYVSACRVRSPRPTCSPEDVMRLSLCSLLVFAGLGAVACSENTTAASTPLEAPASLSSISLDSAIYLDWADNAYQSDPSRFSIYRVYSASYDLNHGSCLADWAIEGTTVAHVFLAAQLANGVPRCFATSAISCDGLERDWSPLWQDTPRPDARKVLAWHAGGTTPQAGFRV